MVEQESGAYVGRMFQLCRVPQGLCKLCTNALCYNLPQYMCCAYRVMVTGEDVSVCGMKSSSRNGVRCVRDMCRRVRMWQGWFNIREGTVGLD